LPFLTVLWCSGELKLVFRTPFCNYLFLTIFLTLLLITISIYEYFF